MEWKTVPPSHLLTAASSKYREETNDFHYQFICALFHQINGVKLAIILAVDNQDYHDWP